MKNNKNIDRRMSECEGDVNCTTNGTNVNCTTYDVNCTTIDVNCTTKGPRSRRPSLGAAIKMTRIHARCNQIHMRVANNIRSTRHMLCEVAHLSTITLCKRRPAAFCAVLCRRRPPHPWRRRLHPQEILMHPRLLYIFDFLSSKCLH